MKNLSIRRVCGFSEVEPMIERALVDNGIIERFELEGLRVCEYDDNIIEVHDSENREYMVIHENNVFEEVKEMIQYSLSSFDTLFLAGYLGMSPNIIDILKKGGSYGDSEGALEELINREGGMDDFVEIAIKIDGAGHFLSPYDGQELKIVTDDGEVFMVYRVN